MTPEPRKACRYVNQLIKKLQGAGATYLELVTKNVLRVRTPGEVRRRRGGGGRISKDTRPLLDGFVVILYVQNLVYRAMVDLYLRPWSTVPWVCVFHNVGPLLLSID